MHYWFGHHWTHTTAEHSYTSITGIFISVHWNKQQNIVFYQIVWIRKEMQIYSHFTKFYSLFLCNCCKVFLHPWSLPLFPLPLSPAPSQPDRVIDLIRHWVRLHYAVLTDKRIAKQLFSFPLSHPKGCVSKRRTSLLGQISLFILIRGLQYWLHFMGQKFHTNGQQEDNLSFFKR